MQEGWRTSASWCSFRGTGRWRNLTHEGSIFVPSSSAFVAAVPCHELLEPVMVLLIIVDHVALFTCFVPHQLRHFTPALQQARLLLPFGPSKVNPSSLCGSVQAADRTDKCSVWHKVDCPNGAAVKHTAGLQW